MDLRKHAPFNLGLYAAVSIGTIAGEVTGSHALVYVCKPLMMVVLSSWFYFNSRRVGDRFTLLIQAGLLFSLVGDIALMVQHRDEFNFLIGLGAFLIAQLCYAIAFLHNIAEVGPSRGGLVSTAIAVLLATYGYFFASRLLPMVDDAIAIPVTIYAVAICFMGATAAFRLGRTFLRSFFMALVGAFFFILSDSLLATNRFLFPVEHAAWSIILTYAIAQVLIVWGSLVHVLDPEEIRRKAALNT